MSPVATGRRRGPAKAATTRRPLASSNSQRDHIGASLREIFNNSQHVTTTDQALNQLKKLYATSDFKDFEQPFMECLKKLLQSKQSIYFKTSCDFVCKFLQHVTTNLEDERLVRSCADVADHYMQIIQDDLRLNAVIFICKILSHVESLDEEICKVLKVTLPKRFRDKKPAIRAQALMASRKFQDDQLIRQGFQFHFYNDPELTVRKALILTMDTEIFGYDFLAESTQDSHEAIRKAAFLRLSKILPSDLSLEQMHQIMHNGLFERERQASFSFKTNTLEPWLGKMYDGLDLTELLKYFDVISFPSDVIKLLALVHERDLDKIENNGTATKLHHVVEGFRERWLSSNNKCLPNVDRLDERVITIWLSLVTFCKRNSSIIKPVKIRTIQSASNDLNESIEKILDSQSQNNEEVAELYERLTPDLVNLADFLERYVRHIAEVLRTDKSSIEEREFVYHKLMGFMSTYEIGDELERKTVQEVLGSILSENLLTNEFHEFIPPIVKCLQKLIYPTSSNLMINYISELIQNIRSHLEDLSTEFKHHPNELIKCLQMYYACLERVKLSEVPPTMINHLNHLSYESLDPGLKNNSRVRSLMVACNGITALLDKDFAKLERTGALLISSCYDSSESLEVRTMGFRSLVDVIVQHEEVNVPLSRLEKFLITCLRDYGKYDPKTIKKNELEYASCLVHGTMKLFYFQKLHSPEVLSHIIIWWYHPRTHSRITQFIGVALPLFIKDLSAKRSSKEDDWLEELLAETFVTSIEYLCDYILGPANRVMSQGDMLNLISFLCNLVPISFHPRVHDVVDKRIDDLSSEYGELKKYLKQSKNSLTAAEATMLAKSRLEQSNDDHLDPLVKPLKLFD